MKLGFFLIIIISNLSCGVNAKENKLTSTQVKMKTEQYNKKTKSSKSKKIIETKQKVGMFVQQDSSQKNEVIIPEKVTNKEDSMTSERQKDSLLIEEYFAEQDKVVIDTSEYVYIKEN